MLKARLSLVDIFSIYTLKYKYLNSIEWADPNVAIVRVVVVDIAAGVDIEHPVRVVGKRSSNHYK